MNGFEYHGMWWLPAHPENTVPGILAFSNEGGIALKLIGALEDSSTFTRREPYPLILGLSGEGKEITLSDCLVTSLQVGIPGFARESYKVTFCLIGAHFASPEEIMFSRLAVRYSHLADWVRTSGFEVKRNWAEHRVEITYSLPAELEAETPKGLVSLSFTCNTTGDAIEEMNLYQSVWMEVNADNEYSFRELDRHYIRPLKNLVSLATTKPNTILELLVFSKQVVSENNAGLKVETPIQLFFEQAYFEARSEKLLIPDNMLFTVHDIANDFRLVLERWFSVSQELDSVCNLFFGVQSRPELNLENKFLNIVQAIETYHRRRMSNEVLPRAEHKARKLTILNKMDGDLREWLTEVLAYSNEPRLEHRIRELLDKTYEAIAPLVRSKEEFAKKVKDTRNYLTHYDKRLKNKAAKTAELFWLTRTLSHLLQVCFLLELGLPLERCAQLLHRNQTFILAQGQSERIRGLQQDVGKENSDVNIHPEKNR